jgi:hypothetical protein
MTRPLPLTGPGPDQDDVDALRGLLDLMANFRDNDQRARYLLSSNWMCDRGAAAAARLAARPLSRPPLSVLAGSVSS